MDALQAAFERDLRAWLIRVYERRAGLARRRLEQRILKVLDSERRWLVPLTIGVLFGVGAVPMLGLTGILVSLVVLYVGAILSGYITMRRAERLERSIDPRADAQAAAFRAWEQRPPMGPDERAQLVRIMNMAAAPPSLRAALRPLLLEEVQGALGRQPLGSWLFLNDLHDMLRAEMTDPS